MDFELGIGPFLGGAVLPLAKKVLIGLGIGWLTYSSFNALFDYCVGYVQQYWGQLGTVTLQILSLAGFPEAIGIILGGVAARIALRSSGVLGKVVS